MIVGYTPGGSPIIVSGPDRPRRKSKGDKNVRIGCPCGAKTTRNQARINGGLCHQCKQPLRALKGANQ